MRTLSLFILATLLLVVPAIAGDANVDIGDLTTANVSGNSGYTGPIWDGPKAVLWDNGPFITQYGTGAGGADESLVEPPDINHGWGCYWVSDLRLSDDFDVPAGETWEITSITVFGYQTFGGPPSTITETYIEIFDGPPETGTSVWGDLFTDVLTTTAWTNVYRVQPPVAGTGTDRPIMANVCEFGTPIVLTEGTYYLVWQLAGTEASGPWSNPITITGQLETGDAMQYYDYVWDFVLDNDSGAMKGMPFILEGSIMSLENETWATIKTVF
jgi:hypothetical protein